VYDIDACVRKTQETCLVTTTGPRAREKCISVWKCYCAACAVSSPPRRVPQRVLGCVRPGASSKTTLLLYILSASAVAVSSPTLTLQPLQPDGRRDVQNFSGKPRKRRLENGPTPDYVEFRARTRHSRSYLAFAVTEYTAECRQPEFWRREIFHVTTRYSVIIISARSIVFLYSAIKRFLGVNMKALRRPLHHNRCSCCRCFISSD